MSSSLAKGRRTVSSGGRDQMAVAAPEDVDLDGVGALAERPNDRGPRVLGRDDAAAAMGDHQRPAHYFTPAVSDVGARWRWSSTKATSSGATVKTSAAIT